jgi:hypothetical protein
VTDQAHGYSRSRELPAVTIRAGLMTGKAGRGGIVAAIMTRGAGDRAMTGAVVKKFRVVSFGTLGRGGHG